jgi:hypothetical protein
METYEQVYTPHIYNMTSANITNCFSCHTTVSTIKLNETTYKNKQSPMYFSHVFRSYMSKSTGVTIKEIEKLRIKEMIELRASRPQ